MKLPSKKVIVTSLLVVGGVAGIAVMNAPASGGADTSPLVQQVQSNTDELANHEARITNNSNDIAAMQSGTNTAPSSSDTTPPAVTAPAPSQTVNAPAPEVMVVGYEQLAPVTDTSGIDCIEPAHDAPIATMPNFDPHSSCTETDCLLTYSDGTTYQWAWEVYNPDGVFEDPGGQDSATLDHYAPVTGTVNHCDASVVGSEKV